MRNLLHYHEGASLLHRLNPVAKLIIAFSICVAAFSASALWFLAALFALDIALGFAAGNGRNTLALARNLVVVSAFLFVLQLLFVRTGDPVLLFVTDEGLRIAATVVLRLIDATMPLALMLQLTRFNDLTNALVSVARIPYKYAFTVTTAMRFVPVFGDEMAAILEAQAARGVALDGHGPLRKLRMILPLTAPLVISAAKRSEQIAMAAEVRGFHLRTRASSFKRYAFTVADYAACAASIALVVVGVLL